MEERFVPSTEELRHWIHYGTEGCPCNVCVKMRRLSDEVDPVNNSYDPSLHKWE